MNQTIAKLDVAPSRQQKRGISGQRVFTLVPCLVYNLNVPIKSKRPALVRCSNGKRGGFYCYKYTNNH